MKQSRSVDPRLFTILLIVFVQMTGASMALPVLSLYAQREFNMEPQVITLLLASFFAAQFIAGPTIGRLSDERGRLPVLIISQIGTVIGFIMLAVAQSVPVLFFARILDGITGGNIIVAQAYITDITPPEKRTQSIGLIFAAFGMGFVVGPAIGGILAAVFDERAPFFIAAIAAAITLFITWRTLDETITPEQRTKNKSATTPKLNMRAVLGNQPLVLVLVVSFVGQFGLGLLSSTFALYGEDVLFVEYNERVTNLGIGVLLMMVGIGQVFTQTYLLKRLLKHYSNGMLVIMGSILRAVSMFALAMTVTPLPAAPEILFAAVGAGIMRPPLQTMATQVVPDAQRGNVLGLTQSSISLATIFSTAIAGSLYAVTPNTPYWLAGILFLVAMLPGFIMMRTFDAPQKTQRTIS